MSVKNIQDLKNDIEKLGDDLSHVKQEVGECSDLMQRHLGTLIEDLSERHDEMLKKVSMFLGDEEVEQADDDGMRIVKSNVEVAWNDFKDSLESFKSSFGGMV